MKRIIIVLCGLVLAALLGVTAATPAYAEGEHEHCICGEKNGSCIETASTYGHEGDASKTAKITKQWTPVSSEAEVEAAIAAAKNASLTEVYMYFTGPVTFTKAVVTLSSAGKGMHVYFCLNGQTLTTAGTVRLISTYSETTGDVVNISVSVCDCQGGGVIQAPEGTTGITAQGGIGLFSNDSYFYLYGGTVKGGKSGKTSTSKQGGNFNFSGDSRCFIYGGTVSGGTSGSYGGNISLTNTSELTIYDGTVSGGTSTTYGGNINVGSSGKLKIYKGTVSDGTATTYGGNINLANDATFDMYGGTVSGGTASTKQGGNINLSNSSAFDMYGGTISGGTSKTYGGSVSVNSSTTSFTMHNEACTVSGGTSTTSGGSIYNAGTLTINNGTISDGRSTTHGGSIVTEGTVRVKGGTISGGTAGSYGGNVSITSKGTLEVSGGTIQNGKANEYGGNIHNGGTFTMTGGTVKDGTANLDASSNSGKDPGGNLFCAATGTISGGTISGGTAYRGGNINVGGKGNLTISGTAKVIGGTSSVNGKCISVAGTLIITGGFIEATNTKDFAINTFTSSNDVSGRANGIKKIEISGGVFNSTGNLIQTPASGSLTITGGVFKKIVAVYGGNGKISGGTFLGNVVVGSSDGVGNGSLEVTGGDFANGITVWNNKIAYGTFVETTDTAPVSGKTYFTRTENVVNSVHSSYTYTVEENLTEFAEGTTYYEADTTHKIVEFNRSTSFENKDGATESGVTNHSVIPVKAPIGKRLALNENLNVLFEGTIDTTLPYLKNGTKLTVSVDGADAVEAAPETVGTLTRYTFAGITPECMMDEITADFVSTGDDGNDYVLYTSTFTIKDYLDAVPTSAEYTAFSADKKAAMDTLITDLKVYGREAQKYFNHKTDNLIVANDFAGSGRVPAGAATTMAPTVTAANASDLDGYFKAATVIHENVIWIRVQYKDNAADGETTFTVDGAAPELVQNNYVCTAGLSPTEFGATKTFTAVRNGSAVATLTYSVNTYCASRHAKDDVFADALYNYGASAAAFATAE